MEGGESEMFELRRVLRLSCCIFAFFRLVRVLIRGNLMKKRGLRAWVGSRPAASCALWINIAPARVNWSLLLSAINDLWKWVQLPIHVPAAASPTITIAPDPLLQSASRDEIDTHQLATRVDHQMVEADLRNWMQLPIHVPAASSPTITIAPDPLLQSATRDENGTHQSATGVDHQMFEAAQEGLLINIWNRDSISKALTNLKSCFEQINLWTQCKTSCSPNASNSSSPVRYVHSDVVSVVKEENNVQHLQFKSYALLHHGEINLIDSTSLLKLQTNVQCRIFSDNMDVLDSFLHDIFYSTGLSIDARALFDPSGLFLDSRTRVDDIKIFVMSLKIITGLLHAMRKELLEARCQSFHRDLKNYFEACAKQPLENIIQAANLICKMNWLAEHLYQTLVLSEAIVDVLPAIQNLHPDCPDESKLFLEQMRVNFEQVFVKIKCSIRYKLNDSQNVEAVRSHPVTNSLIDFMKLFKNHNSVVQRISCFGNGSSTFCSLLSDVVHYWVKELEEYSSKVLPDGKKVLPDGKRYIFLLNNLTCFGREAKNLLKVLLLKVEHDNIIKSLDEQIELYISEYLDKCWGPILSCLELSEHNSFSTNDQSSFHVFASKFDSVYKDQRTLTLHTQELKTILRGRIRDFITPSCDDFLKSCKRQYIQELFCCYWPCKTANIMKKLLTSVEGLFESEYDE